MNASHEWLQCIGCVARYPVGSVRYHCDACGALLTVERDGAPLKALTQDLMRQRAVSRDERDQSGVWAYREAVLNLGPEHIVTHPEGRTRLYTRPSLGDYAGVAHLQFKHEGENPTGSFKDRGMTVAVSQARRLGLSTVACASTGNTSAALAAYAAQAGMRSVVFIPAGKIASGKLAQSIGYGAKCLAVRGDFDQAMALVQDAARTLGIYLVNSLNPFRLEGQKTIIFELLEQRGRKAPDWIVVPAGNLGNTSAFGKALREAHAAGWIDRLPRLAAIQAAGANPFYLSYKEGFAKPFRVRAETVATAIRIGDPVNYPKAKDAIIHTHGLVYQVTDSELMDAKAAIDRAGIGCEPASAVTLAGVKQLVAGGVINGTDDVTCVLTGHMLKDPDAVLAGGMKVVEIEPTLRAVEAALGK
jgi:threonine synthase